ncbi:MAG: DUF423 domain-containing protein [Psychroflexus sp.]
MRRNLILLGSFLGFIAIILGAFGAHGLEKVLDAEQIQTFETGVKYQIYHALLLVFLGSQKFTSHKMNNILFWFILIGVIFFSGSIYGLATNSLSSFDFKAIAWITPIGGSLLIVSWLLLFINIFKNRNK